jgi:hypothetical protein
VVKIDFGKRREPNLIDKAKYNEPKDIFPVPEEINVNVVIKK